MILNVQLLDGVNVQRAAPRRTHSRRRLTARDTRLQAHARLTGPRERRLLLLGAKQDKPRKVLYTAEATAHGYKYCPTTAHKTVLI